MYTARGSIFRFSEWEAAARTFPAFDFLQYTVYQLLYCMGMPEFWGEIWEDGLKIHADLSQN